MRAGNCGSCWAFATTGTIEAQVYKKNKKLFKLSEQQLVECSGPYGNLGCRAGVIGFAYRYVKDNGIALNLRYPYRGTDSRPCAYTQNLRNATIAGYSWAPIRNEVVLKNVLFSVGPLAIGVDASLFTFQNYKSGIYDDVGCGDTMDKLNHAMMLVGYGTDENWGDYWLLKNSYGKSWGEYGKRKTILFFKFQVLHTFTFHLKVTCESEEGKTVAELSTMWSSQCFEIDLKTMFCKILKNLKV